MRLDIVKWNDGLPYVAPAGGDAASNRFDHIDKHFSKDGLKIVDWVDFEWNQRKRDIPGNGHKDWFVPVVDNQDATAKEQDIVSIESCDSGGGRYTGPGKRKRTTREEHGHRRKQKSNASAAWYCVSSLVDLSIAC